MCLSQLASLINLWASMAACHRVFFDKARHGKHLANIHAGLFSHVFGFSELGLVDYASHD
jgi:hypothetical protein